MDTNDSALTSPPDLEPLLDVTELSSYLGVPVSTIYDWRTRGRGPRAHRLGKHLMFATSDVRTWLAEQREPESPDSVPAR